MTYFNEEPIGTLRNDSRPWPLGTATDNVTLTFDIPLAKPAVYIHVSLLIRVLI